jgi:phosphoglycolate phosphatase-like HAD superfamily hydrolase
MLFLVDLDGTLTATESSSFREYKNGIKPIDPADVRPKVGATEFVSELLERGDTVVIVSDSHPDYVTPVVRHWFRGVSSISLCDKPNLDKVVKGLRLLNLDINHEDTYLLGDSWLDVHLGRGLRVPTILIEHHEAGVFDRRDGIGDRYKNYRAGPTFIVRSFDEVLSTVSAPVESLLALEAGFLGKQTGIARRQEKVNFSDSERSFVRTLARQVDGECDRYEATRYYREFERPDRQNRTLQIIADSVCSYLRKVVAYPNIRWSILSYIPDKPTTKPPDKLSSLIKLVGLQMGQELQVTEVFSWKESVDGSIRSIAKRDSRIMFLRENLSVRQEASQLIRGCNIIIIDDQYTTGATADFAKELLREHGAKSVLFIALYQLVDAVASSKMCPACGKPMRLKVRRDGMGRFYSCVPPQYKGDGCGEIVNIEV